MITCNSHLEAFHLDNHVLTRWRGRKSFSLGNLITCAAESISMLKNVRAVVGPTVLSAAMEEPSRAQVATAVSIAMAH